MLIQIPLPFECLYPGSSKTNTLEAYLSETVISSEKHSHQALYSRRDPGIKTRRTAYPQTVGDIDGS